MKAARLFIECLENEGVDYVFGVPGEENLDVMDEFLSSKIRFITTRHEQGAAFMADVYGRLTGRAGVCLSTLGPGATNLITGVADANMDHAPLVAIAGQASTTRLHKESHQVLDLEHMFQPITKYSTTIVDADIIPEVVRKAFGQAESEKTGASFIEFPENIAEETLEHVLKPLLPPKQENCHPSDTMLEEVANIIENARYPMILAGNGVVRAGAHEALSEFAAACHIPVANTFMAKGVIPFKHPMALGSAGLQAQDYVGCGFNRADVIVCIGFDIVEYHPHLWNPDADRTLIHIDRTRVEVDAHYNVSHSIVGDISTTLGLLGERIQRPDTHPLRPLREALIKAMNEHRDDTAFPIKPQKIIWDLRTALRLDDVVICDVGAHKMWMARMFRCENPNTCIISNGFASMGIAVPGAIAAKLVHPDKTIVAVTGDAGFMMNSQELETAVRLNTAIIVLIWNDNGYGLIEWKQMNRFQRKSHVNFNNPDFVQYAESFGAWAYRVQPGDDLQAVIQQAKESGKVAVIDCPVDYSENVRLTEALGDMVCPV